MLQDIDQNWVRDQQQLKDMIIHHFQSLYTSMGHRDYEPILLQCPQMVTEDMNTNLIRAVTQEELRQAVFQLGATKAPGPDGLNGLFYQHYWDILKADLFGLVQDFFCTGVLQLALNQTTITLIPKVPNPKRLDQYHPISLCNYIYKIISKILANRLKPWLPMLISPEQSAFISGRQIQDNILIVQEVLHQLRIRKRKKHFQAVLKLDMQKAYDRVEWDFLRDYMLKLGFSSIWVQRVMECITTSTLSVRFNGENLPYIHPTRGLRQGDPLSPYLFILVANVLSILIQQALHMGNLKGITLNRWCPTLSHLLFADDVVFFLDGKLRECQNLANLLNQYCLATGQTVNRNKSGILFSKACPIQLQENLA